MNIKAAFKSQYHASLAMLLDAVKHCPPDLWASEEYANPYWRIAYHALFYTHLYLQPSERDFEPWQHHRPGQQRLGASAESGVSVTPYSVEEIAAYWRRCDELVDPAVDLLDLSASESGFDWYRMSKLEHQLVNLRHLQHHTGQLADRLRQAADHGVRWVGGALERE
jgi:hypothetical protein